MTFDGPSPPDKDDVVTNLVALFRYVSRGALPVAAFIDTGALARVAALTRHSDLELSVRSSKVLVTALVAASNAEVRPVADALRPALSAAYSLEAISKVGGRGGHPPGRGVAQ